LEEQEKIKLSHSADLRKGRFTEAGATYLVTTRILPGLPSICCEEPGKVLSESSDWLEQQDRWIIHARVWMPDHIHLLFTLRSRQSLSRVIGSFKGFTGKRLAELFGKSPIWQDGFHDHRVRDEADFWYSVRYIAENAVRKGLVQKWDDYPSVVAPKGFETWESPKSETEDSPPEGGSLKVGANKGMRST